MCESRDSPDLLTSSLSIILLLFVGLNTESTNFAMLHPRRGWTLMLVAYASTLLSTLVIVPLFAFITVRYADISEGSALGIITAALCPGGAMANVFAVMGGANSELNAVLTATEQVASGALVPFGLLVVVPLTIDAPTIQSLPYSALAEGVGMVVIPMILGIMLSYAWGGRRPAQAIRWSVLALFFLVVVNASVRPCSSGFYDEDGHVRGSSMFTDAGSSAGAQASYGSAEGPLDPLTLRACVLFGVGALLWGVALALMLPDQSSANRNSIILEVGVRDMAMVAPIIIVSFRSLGGETQARAAIAVMVIFMVMNIGSLGLAISMRLLRVCWCSERGGGDEPDHGSEDVELLT
jgi:predicted Na+-dependent transporter